MSAARAPLDLRRGEPPWEVDFLPQPRPLPARVEVAIVGGGFTGLATAAWLRRLAPDRSVVLLEAGRLGQAASGRSGGLVLDETAVGPLAGLDRVLDDFAAALVELGIPCDFERTGAWEISRRAEGPGSPLVWQDSGTLRVAGEVPGGTLDPGKLVSGLARAAEQAGAAIHEHTPVRRLHFDEPPRLELDAGELTACQVLLGVNGSGLALSAWLPAARAKFTLAAATAPLTEDQWRIVSAVPLKPFYTLDLPYLWGRPLPGRRILFGGGLVPLESAADLEAVDVRSGEAARLLAALEARIRGLHPALAGVAFERRWGGPILFPPSGRPILGRHPESPAVMVLGGYTGQGVALSVVLGRWAAEAMLGRRELPAWGRPGG